MVSCEASHHFPQLLSCEVMYRARSCWRHTCLECRSANSVWTTNSCLTVRVATASTNSASSLECFSNFSSLNNSKIPSRSGKRCCLARRSKGSMLRIYERHRLLLKIIKCKWKSVVKISKVFFGRIDNFSKTIKTKQKFQILTVFRMESIIWL